MPIRYDIAIDGNDLVFYNGDLVIAQSDTQHVIDTINAFPGWWKEYPFDGVGIMAYNKAPLNAQEISRKMKLNLSQDGYSAQDPSVKLSENGQLIINPNIQAV